MWIVQYVRTGCRSSHTGWMLDNHHKIRGPCVPKMEIGVPLRLVVWRHFL